MANGLFREKTIQSISSPEKLTDYLRVNNPGIVLILAAVIILLGGLFAWISVGDMEISIDEKASVEEGKARVVISSDSEEIKTGMVLRIDTKEYIISEINKDEYGRSVVYSTVTLPDGTYDGDIVVKKVNALKYLLGSR